MAGLIERHRDEIVGVLSCFERVLIQGTPPSVCHATAMEITLNGRGGIYVRLGDAVRAAIPRSDVKQVAAEEGVELE